MFHVEKLGHAVLKVSDLERSVRFYTDVMGFKEVGRLGDVGVFFTLDDTDHHHLAVMKPNPEMSHPADQDTGLHHIALKVGDDIEQLREAKRWMDENQVPITLMRDHLCTLSVYVTDPDGNGIELYVDADPVWREDPSKVASTAPLEL